MKITIGTNCYNDTEYTIAWLKSVVANISKEMRSDTNIVVVDDGTPSEAIKEKVKMACQEYNAIFIEHGFNKGVPAGWNTIAKAIPDAELICIFNNDTRVTSPDTFVCAQYFMEHNPMVGASSWPMVYVYPTLERSNWYDHNKLPAISRQVIGAGFWIRGDVYRKSRGFYEELWSLWEEVDISFEVYRLGYEIIMMSYPSFEHWFSKNGLGHYTCANNPELVEEHNRKKNILGGLKAMWRRRWEQSADVDGNVTLVKQLVYPRMKYHRLVYWMDADRIEMNCLVPKEMPCRYDPIDGVIEL